MCIYRVIARTVWWLSDLSCALANPKNSRPWYSIYPDFITVDGGEGGAGAAPPEFSNSIGTPLPEGLSFVQAVLVGAGFRDPVDK